MIILLHFKSNNYELRTRAEKIILEEEYHLKHFRILLDRLSKRDEGKKLVSEVLNKSIYDLFSLFEADESILSIYNTDIFPISYEEHFSRFYETIKKDFYFYHFPKRDELFNYSKSLKSSRSGMKSDEFINFYNTFTEVFRIEPDAKW